MHPPLSSPVPVYLGFILVGVVTVFLGPVLPSLIIRYSLTDSAAGSLFAAQFFAATVATILSGWMVRRYALRTVLLYGYSALAAGILLLTLPGFPVTVAGVCLYGFGIGLSIPTSNLLIAEHHPARPAAALNLLNLCWAAGAVAGPYFIALLLTARGLPAVAALLSAALILALAAFALRTPRGSVPESPQRTGSPLPDRAGTYAGIVLFLYVGAESLLSGWLPTLAVRTLDAGPETAALPQSVFWASILAGRLCASLLLRWTSVHTLILRSLALAAIGFAAVLLAWNLPTLVAAAALAGFGMAAVFPNVVAAFSTFKPERARATIWFIFALGGLGGGALPWLGGGISTYFQSIHACIAFSLVTILAIAAIWTRAPLGRTQSQQP